MLTRKKCTSWLHFQLCVHALTSIVLLITLCKVHMYFPLLVSCRVLVLTLLMSYSQSCQKAWSACHLGNERCLCSERLVYTLESGHLLFIHLGPSSALYVHLILNTFVSGKEENALAWQQSPWTTHWATCTSCTSPLHLYQSSLACGEREWLPSFPFSSENVLILLPLMRFLSIVVYSILELLESRSVRVV